MPPGERQFQGDARLGRLQVKEEEEQVPWGEAVSRVMFCSALGACLQCPSAPQRPKAGLRLAPTTQTRLLRRAETLLQHRSAPELRFEFRLPFWIPVNSYFLTYRRSNAPIG